MPARQLGRWLAELLCGVLLCLALSAQAQQRAFEYLRQEQGLENLAVTALVQDGAGHVWIGTENGLYRFDGTHIRRYGAAQGLADPRIAVLHVDAAGLLWIGTPTMLLHGEGDRFVQVRNGDRSIGVRAMQTLASSLDAVIVNGMDGLYRLRRSGAGWQVSEMLGADERQRQPELGRVHGVLAEPGGDVWFGCGLALCRWSEGRVRIYRAAGQALAQPLTSLLRMPDGQLLMRSGPQLWRLDFGAETLQDMPLPAVGEMPAPLSPPLLADGNGRVLTQWGDGVARWDGHRWELIGAREGLQAAGGVTALLLARDGGVWLGTAGAGLAHWLGYRHAQSWGAKEGLPSEDVWAFLRSAAGTLYIGTAAGLTVQAGDGPARGIVPSAWRRAAFASSLAEDARGRIWVGSFDGSLGVLDPRTRQLRPVARLPRITRLLPDPLGQLWVVTHDGIYLMSDPAHSERLLRVDDGLYKPSSVPQGHHACVNPGGQVWISTQRGLLRSDGQRLVRVPLVDEAGQLPADQEFLALACGTDHVWMGGTDSGLWQGRLAADGSLHVQRIEAPLLDGRAIVTLHQDRRGWLWVATDYGVAVYRGNRWRFIRQDAGLPWNDCNQGALYEDRDGSMWVGTSRGAARLDDLASLFDEPWMDVRIEPAGDWERQAPAASLTLPWRHRALVLSLSSGALESRKALRFDHRMQGLDEDWHSGTETELAYPGLPPGRYRFEVRARNLDLQAESLPEALDIEVLPPWWRAAWFYVLSGLLLALLAWACYHWRLRSLLRRQRHLEQLVAERTREIEASHAQMRELALRDGLTGVLNRRAIGEAITAEVSRADRSRRPLALVLVDADHFKRVNDQYGHQAGDAVLVALARRLQAHTRPYDHLGRYGGEEFVLLLPDLDPEQPLGRARIEAFHHAISESPVELAAGERLDVSCSFGVACLAGGGLDSPDALIARADAALYRAKANGRNRIEYASPDGSG